jgi:hypothetical protein
MRAEALRIAGAGALLTLVLTGLVVREGQARAAGREVRLAMEGVDPRALLTGHYAALSLAEPLPAGAPCPPGTDRSPPTGPFESRPVGWVALAPAGAAWRPVAVAETRSGALRAGQVAVRGRLDCRAGERLELDIGVRRFHASQREAEALEAALRDGGTQAYAVVSVGRDGRARLKGVEAGGRRVTLDWF